MKTQSGVAFSIAGVALALALFGYLEVRFMGFPDGFLTELDRGRRVLWGGFAGLSLVALVWFAYLGWLAFNKNISRPLAVSAALYAGFAALAAAVDFYLRKTLNGGGGG